MRISGLPPTVVMVMDHIKVTKPHGLGEFVFYRTYSRPKPNGSKESFFEVLKRVIEGHSIGKTMIKPKKSKRNKTRVNSINQRPLCFRKSDPTAIIVRCDYCHRLGVLMGGMYQCNRGCPGKCTDVDVCRVPREGVKRALKDDNWSTESWIKN